VHEANLAAEVARASSPCGQQEVCAVTDPAVRELFAQRIAERLKDLSRHEQIACFTLLSQPFTVDRGELTPTLKLRRGIVAEHYAAEIEAMYRAAPTR
jgi:long-chain acyl-CoA synthetase